MPSACRVARPQSVQLQVQYCRAMATSAAAMVLWRLLSMLASAALAEAASLCFNAAFSSICWSLYKGGSVRQYQTNHVVRYHCALLSRESITFTQDRARQVRLADLTAMHWLCSTI